MKGTIKKLVTDKPFGFIAPSDQPAGAADIYFHESKLTGVTFADLHEGDSVTFEIEETEKDGQKKTNATNVQKTA